MKRSTVYHLINDWAVQCIDFVGIVYFLWRMVFYTLCMLQFFHLYEQNVCFYFLNSFLNTRQINIKKYIWKFAYQPFFDGEIRKWGENQYPFQVVRECQVGDLPSNWREFQPWSTLWQMTHISRSQLAG